ncbi:MULTISPECIES: Hsp33 family molecular chaperone HslO [Shouchella]|uniref:33 kDa chaperonin n=3 Tax=Bacillaceae TaxID=186817 RepID=A0A060M971_9BACI|nr:MULTISPECIES: Hsp33 family molecular chaperone HslO [Bacillaceae]RQW18117.1 Hsp33 family molecular chaperone HslO [Bacillus sp. C1-1]AIC96629.1 33 kDa chaperonin [Shouchella lehensis G1]KQL51652.1 heat-shock protein Hsp33 [Alkalicoccobacillus plakortidis]MBG9782368.1 heat shock protein Hsp33 [Shouchella lehensis]TES46895.1 Hsp33 family molecular chaperone HslO [Shouchella lehensis]
MNDYLVRATAYNGEVRAIALTATDMVSEACRRQGTWPTASAALGRAMMGGTMMASMLKGEAKLTVRIEGNGPIGQVIVDSHADGSTRGTVTNPHVSPDLNSQGKLDVARVVGTEGTLSVVKDLGMKEPFTGSVPLVSGEIGDDFTYYFANSEQTPSSVGVGVLVNPDETILAAGGFVIQMMPGAQEHTISDIEQRLSNVPAVSKLVEKGLSPEEILHTLLGESNVKLLETKPVQFNCSCSKERIANAIISLGQAEIDAMIKEDQGAETTCNFCNETYTFTEDELVSLLDFAK